MIERYNIGLLWNSSFIYGRRPPCGINTIRLPIIIVTIIVTIIITNITTIVTTTRGQQHKQDLRDNS
jgi:hypothetical protein